MKCAVNPSHCQGGWSEACQQYEHEATKELKCGNCCFFRGEGEICGNHYAQLGYRDSNDKACWDFESYESVKEEIARERRENWMEHLSQFHAKLFPDNKIMLIR